MKKSNWKSQYIIDNSDLIIVIIFATLVVLLATCSSGDGCSCSIRTNQSMKYNCESIAPEKLLEAQRSCLSHFKTKTNSITKLAEANRTCVESSKELLCEPIVIKKESKTEK